MTYQLIPLEKGSTPLIPLQRPVLLIGRHPECDVRIDLAKISRRHCCVALAYDRVLVRDLGSHNGVRVNGRVVQEATLRVGDEVAIGPLIYRLFADAQEPVAARPGASPRPTARSQGKPELSPRGSGLPSTPPSVPRDVDEIGLIPIDDL
jgi:predicted component of type VI protein secretion system